MRRIRQLLLPAIALTVATGITALPADAATTPTKNTVAVLASADPVAVLPGKQSSIDQLVQPLLASAPSSIALCGCQNTGFVKWAMGQLGVKHMKEADFKARLGKTIGHKTYVSLRAALATNAPRIRKRIPYPNRKARSATHEPTKSAPYNVYQIFYEWPGPEYSPDTWKFGITRQSVPKERPSRQIPTCNKWLKKAHPGAWKCDWFWEAQNVEGWFRARTLEADLTVVYALFHKGYCPPGMPACV
jgi:hypothetical protein